MTNIELLHCIIVSLDQIIIRVAGAIEPPLSLITIVRRTERKSTSQVSREFGLVMQRNDVLEVYKAAAHYLTRDPG